MKSFLKNAAEALGLKQADPTERACADEAVSVAAAGHQNDFVYSCAHTVAVCQLSGLNRHEYGDSYQR